jgi:uncharacterized protein DUF6285
MTQDRPDAAELLDAVAEYLFGELRPQVPREQRFKIVVAANVCAVVAREIRAGEGPTRKDLALFRELLGEEGDMRGGSAGARGLREEPPVSSGEEPSDSLDPEALDQATRQAAGELAGRLRAGELDDRLDELAPKLAEHVRRKLEIARPGYADSA